jgi:hypothetical protein
MNACRVETRKLGLYIAYPVKTWPLRSFVHQTRGATVPSYSPCANFNDERWESARFDRLCTTTDTRLILSSPGCRFAWIDLTAGPFSYGPVVGGEGLRTDGSVPDVEQMFGNSTDADSKPGKVV